MPQPGESLQGHYFYGITGDYFSALGIPLREGRFLTSADSHRPERVCVVDEDFARRYWPNGGALGQRVFQGSDSDDAQLFTIVGVVGAVKQAELTEPQGQGAVYVPYRYRDSANVFVVTRTSQRPEAFADSLRQLVRATDPELAIDDIRSMETRIAESLIARRSPAMLAGIVAGVALLLAAIGTYGVLSYTIAQRRREIGVRMALGAQTRQIRTQFLSLGLRLLAAGILLGVMGAWAAGKAHGERPLRRAHASPRHAFRDRACHGRRVTGCLPHPRASRVASRPDDCPARRIEPFLLIPDTDVGDRRIILLSFHRTRMIMSRFC